MASQKEAQMIEVEKKTWRDKLPPYIDSDNLNDNQQALEACVVVFNSLEKEWES